MVVAEEVVVEVVAEAQHPTPPRHRIAHCAQQWRNRIRLFRHPDRNSFRQRRGRRRAVQGRRHQYRHRHHVVSIHDRLELDRRLRRQPHPLCGRGGHLRELRDIERERDSREYPGQHLIDSPVATTSSSATITWTTNQAASSTVLYGTTTSYGSASSSTSFVTSHSITLTGLSASATYDYEVVSTNEGNQTSTSTNETFTTASSGGSSDTSNFTWQQLSIGAGGYETGMSIANDDTMVLRTDTYGAYLWNGEWQQLVTSSSMPASFVDHSQFYNSGVYAIQVAANDFNVMFMDYPIYQTSTSTEESSVYVSTNKGSTWTLTNFTPVPQASMNANGTYRYWGEKMAVDPNNAGTVYVGTLSNGMFVSTTSGSTWSTISSVPVATGHEGITGIEVDPANSNIVYAASYGNGIYETTGGPSGSWSKIDGSSGPTTVYQAAVASTGAYYVVDELVQPLELCKRHVDGATLRRSVTVHRDRSDEREPRHRRRQPGPAAVEREPQRWLDLERMVAKR